jgi:hypothetical protein
MRIGNKLTLYLLIACMLLAGSLLFRGRQADNTVTVNAVEAQRAATQESQQAGAGFTPPGIRAFREVLERPLFTPGRAPPPAPAIKAAPATPVAPLRLQIEGVAITDDARIAVVRDLGTNKTLQLAEGNVYQGWVVETVDTTGARFRHGEQTHELFLDANKSGDHAR